MAKSKKIMICPKCYGEQIEIERIASSKTFKCQNEACFALGPVTDVMKVSPDVAELLRLEKTLTERMDALDETIRGLVDDSLGRLFAAKYRIRLDEQDNIPPRRAITYMKFLNDRFDEVVKEVHDVMAEDAA